MNLMNFGGITQFELERLSFNLNIEYPPPYEWLFWQHKKARIYNIKKINWISKLGFSIE